MKIMAEKNVQILFQTRIITNSIVNPNVIKNLKNRGGPGFNSKNMLERLTIIFTKVT
jgi:hypothetical protein